MPKNRKSVKNNREIAREPLLPTDSKIRSREIPVDGLPCLYISINKTTRTFGYRPTLENGSKPRLSLGTFPAMQIEEAKSRAWEILAMVEKGLDPRDDRRAANAMPTFAEFLSDSYLPHARQHKKSIKDDESKLRCHMLSVFGPRRLNDIGRREIDQYLLSLTSEEKGLDDSTRNRHLSLLSAIFRKAVEYEIIPHNPCASIKALPENNKRDRHLEDDELSRFIAACHADTNRVLGRYFLFQLFTGLRKCEGLDAKWEHVDFAAQTLFLPHTKSGKSRHVRLSLPAFAILQELHKEAINDYVFPGRCEGKPYNNPYKALTRVKTRAGLANFRLHDLRHTFASVAANNDVPLAVLQQLLGHASLATTQRYAHWYSSRLQQATNQVGDAIQRYMPAAVPAPVDQPDDADGGEDALPNQAA